MESKHNTRKDSDRVRLRDDDTGSTEPEQVDQQSSFADLDPTKEVYVAWAGLEYSDFMLTH